MSARQELIALKNQIEQAVPGGSKYFRFLDELDEVEGFCKICNGPCKYPQLPDAQLPEEIKGEPHVQD